MEQAKSENEAPALLRLKAAEFLSIAGKTHDPDIAREARAIAERCITRALELEQFAKRLERRPASVIQLYGDALTFDMGRRDAAALGAAKTAR